MRARSLSLNLCSVTPLGTLACQSSARGGEDITPLLEKIRATREIPALAAAAIKDGEIVAVGATGLRHLGGKTSVTVDDLWHIGSCTKSMTSSVAAMLVEKGKLRWEQTVG